MLFRCPQGPKSDGPSTKLCEPALKLGLSGVVGQARHVQNLAALRQESTNIGTSVHRPSQDVGVFVGRLRLANEAAENTSQSDSFLHGAARRSRSKRLQVEREIVLDRGARLHRLNLERCTNVREHARAEWQRFGMVLLPTLVLGTEVESSRVLQIGGKHDSLVPSFTGKLDAKIPSIKCDEDEVQVLIRQMLTCECIEPVDCISKRSRITDMLPGEGR